MTDDVPLELSGKSRQGKGVFLPVGIDQNVQKRVPVSAVFDMILCVQEGKCQRRSLRVDLPGLSGVEGEFGIARPVLFTVKMRGAKHGMGRPQSDQITHIVVQVLISAQTVPVKPGDLVVLTIGVVVSELSIGELVAREQHGHTPAHEEQGLEVLHLARAK